MPKFKTGERARVRSEHSRAPSVCKILEYLGEINGDNDCYRVSIGNLTFVAQEKNIEKIPKLHAVK